jgi:hypothetical protein
MQIFFIYRQPIWTDSVKPLDVSIAYYVNVLAAAFHAAILQLFGEADVAVRAEADQFPSIPDGWIMIFDFILVIRIKPKFFASRRYPLFASSFSHL